MLISLDPSATVEYSLESDTTDPKTVWVLGLYDVPIGIKIYGLYIKKLIKIDTTYETDTTDLILDAVRFGLKDVKNFNVPFETEEINVPNIGKRTVASAAFIDKAFKHKAQWIFELYHKLMNINFVSEQDSKN